MFHLRTSIFLTSTWYHPFRHLRLFTTQVHRLKPAEAAGTFVISLRVSLHYEAHTPYVPLLHLKQVHYSLECPQFLRRARRHGFHQRRIVPRQSGEREGNHGNILRPETTDTPSGRLGQYSYGPVGRRLWNVHGVCRANLEGRTDKMTVALKTLKTTVEGSGPAHEATENMCRIVPHRRHALCWMNLT